MAIDWERGAEIKRMLESCENAPQRNYQINYKHSLTCEKSQPATGFHPNINYITTVWV